VFVNGVRLRYNCLVPASPCFLVSDAHIGVASRDVERSFVRFLRELRGRAGSLVINGDLFDFWFEWKSVIPRPTFRVLAALSELTDSGLEVLWLAGNHDCWGGDILRDDVGVTYHVGPWSGDLAGWRSRVEHGDGLRDREDRGYRLIRPIMRNPLAIRAFRAIHPDWASRLANGSSGASRDYRARDEGRGLRAIALAELERDASLDLLVYGHSHVPALERVPGRGVFANAGSWLDAPTYLVITPEQVELVKWREGSAEGDRLDVVDRRPEKALTDA
jgi:UDP-2,3-diacylglucosamine hydrolase